MKIPLKNNLRRKPKSNVNRIRSKGFFVDRCILFPLSVIGISLIIPVFFVMTVPLSGYCDEAINTSINDTKEQRIVGGEEASDSWPWMAAVVSGENNFVDLECGAVLIDSKWILTAAHCVTDPPFEILMGTTNLYEAGTRIGVENVYIHPGYFNSEGTLMPDIALVELESDAPFEPISLYEESDALVGVSATVIGWGSTDAFGRRYPNDLMQAEVPIASYEVCNTAYNGILTQYEICAGYPQGGVDTCTGDSGGPMMVYDENQWKLLGITAWGQGCAEPGYYGVYTRISAVADWIAWQKEKPFKKSKETSDSTNCASYDAESGRIHVPCLDLFDERYWFDFQIENDYLRIYNYGQQ